MESNAVMLTILLAKVDFEENKSPLLLKDNEVGFLDSKDLTIKKILVIEYLILFIKNILLKIKLKNILRSI